MEKEYEYKQRDDDNNWHLEGRACAQGEEGEKG